MTAAQRSTTSLGATLEREGFCTVRDICTAARLGPLRDELERLLAVRQSQMARNGLTDGVAGTAHHLLERDSAFVDWLGLLALSPVMADVASALGGKCVLNSIGGVDNRAGATAYVGKVHRDIRTYTSDTRLMMQLLIPLDAFTAQSGATWVLPGSQHESEKPDDSDFFARAIQVIASAGEVILFDSRLWHAAGVNQTALPRRALTLTFTRPFMKPQFDYCRYLGDDYVSALAEPLQQLLGFFARVPATMDEWYQPAERRLYRPGQG